MIVTRNGVTYYSHYIEARDVARRFPGARCVAYGLGWAVQLRASGPYWNREIVKEGQA